MNETSFTFYRCSIKLCSNQKSLQRSEKKGVSTSLTVSRKPAQNLVVRRIKIEKF